MAERAPFERRNVGGDTWPGRRSPSAAESDTPSKPMTKNPSLSLADRPCRMATRGGTRRGDQRLVAEGPGNEPKVHIPAARGRTGRVTATSSTPPANSAHVAVCRRVRGTFAKRRRQVALGPAVRPAAEVSALDGANDDGYLLYTTLERDGGPVVSDALPRCGVLRARKTCRSAGAKSPIAPADRAKPPLSSDPNRDRLHCRLECDWAAGIQLSPHLVGWALGRPAWRHQAKPIDSYASDGRR